MPSTPLGRPAYSNSVEATTPAAPPPPPSAPGNLTSTVVSYSQIDLNWLDDSSNEDENSDSNDASAPWRTVPIPTLFRSRQTDANVTSFNTGLQAQTTYTYRVRAYNPWGRPPYSNSVEATRRPLPEHTGRAWQECSESAEPPGRLNWTGAGVGVAVVDTGLDFNHTDLGLAPEIQGVNAFNAFGGSCQDFHGHGTHVGGIIAAGTTRSTSSA